MTLDEKSRKNIEEIEKNSRFPTGIGQIQRGQCGMDSWNPGACTLCSYGHMLECHFPNTCEEVECDHYKREIENEREY